MALQTAGNDQAHLVQQLLQEQSEGGGSGVSSGGVAAFVNVAVHEDCFGVVRFVTASRSSAAASPASA